MQNATISFLMSVRPSIFLSVRPSVRVEQIDSHWTDFYAIWYLRVFRKYLEKIQLSLKSSKNNGFFTWRPIYNYYNISLNLLRMRNVSDRSCRENQNTHFCWITFSRKSCRLWDNVYNCSTVVQATDDNIVWRVRFAWWLAKATDSHTAYAILTAFPRRKLLGEQASILRYTYIAHLVCFLSPK